MGSEFERIAHLRALFGAPPHAVSTGIGDDAAVLDLAAFDRAAAHLVWTIDACVEGVHFERNLLEWHDVGWRSFMAAASDLAAMGAEPVGALCALALSSDLADIDVEEIGRGQALAAMSLSTSLVGGNLSRAGEVSLSTTLLGLAVHPVRRSGARPGDVLVVAGELGLAAAGLRLLKQGAGLDPRAARAVAAWRRPVALIADGLRLSAVATAMIDVSDGLAQDAGHLADASRVRIELDPAALVSNTLQAVAAPFSLDALALALGGGEDYAVLATVPADRLAPGERVIGRVVQGEGVWLQDGTRVAQVGHDHFR
jgi:thiamine-monophosphate kinase